MVSTLVINVDKELAEFVRHQPVEIDPSAYITKLIHDEMKRENFQASPASQKKVNNDSVTQALEEHIDDVIPSAG